MTETKRDYSRFYRDDIVGTGTFYKQNFHIQDPKILAQLLDVDERLAAIFLEDGFEQIPKDFLDKLSEETHIRRKHWQKMQNAYIRDRGFFDVERREKVRDKYNYDTWYGFYE